MLNLVLKNLNKFKSILLSVANLYYTIVPAIMLAAFPLLHKPIDLPLRSIHAISLPIVVLTAYTFICIFQYEDVYLITIEISLGVFLHKRMELDLSDSQLKRIKCF